MKKIALIHTVKAVADTFEDQLRKGVTQDLSIQNLLDDFLASDPNDKGEFTIENRNRLFMDIKVQEMTGADMIVTTCSTLTPIVEMIRPFIKIPLIAIDDAMAKKGITYGSKILVMATAKSTIAPTRNKLQAEADKAGNVIELDSREYKEAFEAMKAQKMEEHDEILRTQARKIAGYDCIILAQASMAHMEEEISQICNCPVLSSPNLCVAQIEEYLQNNRVTPKMG